MNTTTKTMTHGHGNCIMLLVGEQLGLAPGHIEDARSHLAGSALHPMTAASMERAAVGLNERLRRDPALICQANSLADALMFEHGFRAPAVQSPSA